MEVNELLFPIEEDSELPLEDNPEQLPTKLPRLSSNNTETTEETDEKVTDEALQIELSLISQKQYEALLDIDQAVQSENLSELEEAIAKMTAANEELFEVAKETANELGGDSTEKFQVLKLMDEMKEVPEQIKNARELLKFVFHTELPDISKESKENSRIQEELTTQIAAHSK